MDARTLAIFFLVLSPVIGVWQREDRRATRELRRDIHYHSKRHMLPRETDKRRRTTTQRTKEIRKKPSGHLRPLQEDDIGNDEVVSVAVGPPVMRPKYDKIPKHTSKSINNITDATASNFVKDVLIQIGRELLSHQVNEDYVFGQYVGNAIRNLTANLKLELEHEILEVIVKYQKLSRGDAPIKQPATIKPNDNGTTSSPREVKEKRFSNNDTEDGWPDFTNLAKIVG